MGAIGRFGQRAWQDLGGDPDQLAGVADPGAEVPLRSTLAVGELAFDSVALSSVAAGLVSDARTTGSGEPPAVRPDPARVAASYRSDRLFRWNGEAPSVWGELSGFWRASDGWIRTHGNYPHHDARLRGLLGLDEGAGKDEMRAAVADREAEELEEAAAVAGAILVKVRDAEEWQEHPQGQAVARRPLLGLTELGGAAPRPWRDAAPGPARPLAGVRVLDLTRVIAGPAATRDLAFAGADVLRLDFPLAPEIEWQHLDSGQGKRCAVVDLATPAGYDVLQTLLASADVVVSGYRPGSLDRFGLDPEQLAARFPGLVVGRVSAWDSGGPWSARRGFDSIVQATSGIARRESGDGTTPGALPAQALDHSAGHLLAAGVMTALLRQRADGGSHLVSVSLARVAHELLAQPGRTDAAPDDAALPTVEAEGPAGRIRCAPPVLDWPGAPPAYSWVGGAWGADEPTWA